MFYFNLDFKDLTIDDLTVSGAFLGPITEDDLCKIRELNFRTNQNERHPPDF